MPDECDCQAEIEEAIRRHRPGRAEYLAARCDAWHPKRPRPAARAALRGDNHE